MYELHALKDKDKAKYKRALDRYTQAKLEFEESEKKYEVWLQKVHHIEEELTQRSWSDFMKFAKLPEEPFGKFEGTLEAIQDGLKSMDFSMLDPEIKSFLEVQLGVNFHNLQEDVENAPEAIVNALKNFISFDQERMVAFITYQQARLDKNLI